jgi:hypothetical protein
MAAILSLSSIQLVAAPVGAVTICDWGNVTLTQLHKAVGPSIDATSTVYWQIGYACGTNAKSLIKVTKVVMYVANRVGVDPIRLEETYLFKTSSTSAGAAWSSLSTAGGCTPPADSGCNFTATRTVNYTYPYSTTTFVQYGCQCKGFGQSGFWFLHSFVTNTGTIEQREA